MDKRIGKLNYGQFVFLYYLGRNVEYTVFAECLKALANSDTQPSAPDIPLNDLQPVKSGVYPKLSTDDVDGSTVDTTNDEITNPN